MKSTLSYRVQSLTIFFPRDYPPIFSRTRLGFGKRFPKKWTWSEGRVLGDWRIHLVVEARVNRVGESTHARDGRVGRRWTRFVCIPRPWGGRQSSMEIIVAHGARCPSSTDLSLFQLISPSSVFTKFLPTKETRSRSYPWRSVVSRVMEKGKRNDLQPSMHGRTVETKDTIF